MLLFEKEGETGEKSLGVKMRTNNKLNPRMTPSPGIEPGPQWQGASVHTTSLSLLSEIHGLKRTNH